MAKTKIVQTALMNIEDLSQAGMTGASDAALIMGAWQSQKDKDIAGRPACRLYSATSTNAGRINILETNGDKITCNPNSRFAAVRPSIDADFSVTDENGKPDVLPTPDNPSILKIDKTEVELSVDPFGRYIFYYGAFPQTIAPPDVSKKLEEDKKDSSRTERSYSLPSRKLDEYGPSTSDLSEHYESKVDGKRYVRMTANDSGQVLSNGEVVKAGSTYYCEVQPIQWIYDPTKKTAYTDVAIFAGVPWQANVEDWLFQDKKDKQEETFKKSLMYRHLSSVFSDEMMISYVSCMKQEQISRFNLDDWMKKNPNPKPADFFKVPFWKQGKNVINLILCGGNEAMKKAFPAEEWVKPEHRQELREIFSSLTLTEETKLLLIRFETRLKKAMMANLQKAQNAPKKSDKTL